MKTIAASLCATLVLVVLAACSGRDEQPVAECQEYETLMSSCVDRVPPGLATQAARIPRTPAERVKARDLCAGNLERLRRACR